MAPAAEAQLEPLVDQAVLPHARADARLDEQVGGALLEHAGAQPLLDVLAAVALEHDRGDALAVQQVREQQPRRPGADDANLGLHELAGSLCRRPLILPLSWRSCQGARSAVLAKRRRPRILRPEPRRQRCGG